MRLASTVAACTRIDTLVDPKVALPKAGLQACFRGAVFLRFFLSASAFRQSVLNILAPLSPSRSKTSPLGWPYVFTPEEITAIFGFKSSKKYLEVANLLP